MPRFGALARTADDRVEIGVAPDAAEPS